MDTYFNEVVKHAGMLLIVIKQSLLKNSFIFKIAS